MEAGFQAQIQELSQQIAANKETISSKAQTIVDLTDAKSNVEKRVRELEKQLEEVAQPNVQGKVNPSAASELVQAKLKAIQA